jgi:hypothetical protein
VRKIILQMQIVRTSAINQTDWQQKAYELKIALVSNNLHVIERRVVKRAHGNFRRHQDPAK